MHEENAFLREAARSWLVFAVHLLISIGILALGVFVTLSISAGRSPQEAAPVQEIIPTAETETAFRETGGITFQVDGVVIPFRKVAVASEVSGNITFLSPNCRVGRYIQKGDILMEIDQQDYRHALQEAQQSLIKAAREIEEWKVAVQNNLKRLEIAQEQFNTQKLEVERCLALHEKGAVSQTELDTARLNLLTREEAVVTQRNENESLLAQEERLNAVQELARVAVEKAELNLSRCTLRAPLTGLVVSLDVEQDKFIQRGEDLVSIHDTSRLEVQCSLYMKQVEWLWSENLVNHDTADENTASETSSEQSQLHTKQETAKPETVSDPSAFRQFYQFADTPVRLKYELNDTVYEWAGTLTYLDGPGLDSRTRMMPCRVVVEDPLNVQAFSIEGRPLKRAVSPTLMPGMFVSVEIHANPARPLLNLSEMAVLPGGTVWKAGKNEAGEDVLVRASKIMTAHFDTKSGRILVYAKRGVLEPGDEVIVSPLASPVEGTRIHVQKKTQESTSSENSDAISASVPSASQNGTVPASENSTVSGSDDDAKKEEIP